MKIAGAVLSVLAALVAFWGYGHFWHQSGPKATTENVRNPMVVPQPPKEVLENGYLASKQPYPLYEGEEFHPPSSCELQHVSLVSRHGSRHVTKVDAAQQLHDVLAVADSEGLLTEFGEKYRKAVEHYLTMLPEVKGELSGIGKLELHGIGQREGRRHIDFYQKVEDKKLDIVFESTHKSRSIESMRQFRAGLYSVTPMMEEDVKEHIHSECDALPQYLHLRFFDVCPKFLDHVDSKPWKRILDSFSQHRYSDVPEERLAYQGEETVVSTIMDLSWASRRLRAEETGEAPIMSKGTKKRGTKKSIVPKAVDWDDFIERAYELCQISFGAGIDGQTLCKPFLTDEGEATLRAMQVKEDLKMWHKRGAPSIASEMACPLLKALHEEFLEVTHRHEDTVAARYRFGHAETIYPLMILLDLLPQVIKNRTTGEDVAWSYMGHTPLPGGYVVPMATNVRFEMYDCAFGGDELESRIAAFHNERPVYLPPCDKYEQHLCPFDLVENHWRSVLNNLGGCDIESFTHLCGGFECSSKDLAKHD